MDAPTLAPLTSRQKVSIREACDEMDAVFDVLDADCRSAFNFAEREPSGFADRQVVRAFFALVEGVSFQYRSVIRAYDKARPFLLPKAEKEILKKGKATLDDFGFASESDSYYASALSLVLFGMRFYSKMYLIDFLPRTVKDGGVTVGWNSMIRFYEYRNQVTHPKRLSHLTIAPETVAHGNRAVHWFMNEHCRLKAETEANAHLIQQAAESGLEIRMDRVPRGAL